MINEYTHIRACARRPMLAELTPGWQRCPGLPAPGDMSQAGDPSALGTHRRLWHHYCPCPLGDRRALTGDPIFTEVTWTLSGVGRQQPSLSKTLGFARPPRGSCLVRRPRPPAVLCPNLRSWVARRSLLFCHRYVPCLTGCSRLCSSWLVAVLDWPPAPISESFWGSTPPSSALT